MRTTAMLAACVSGWMLFGDDAVAAEEFDLAEAGVYAKPLDFSVDATRAYVVYARYSSGDQMTQQLDHEDVLLGVYARPSGVHVASVDFAALWDDPPHLGPVPFAETTTYRDGVVVSVVDQIDRTTSLLRIDRNGLVGQRMQVQDLFVTALNVLGDFVVAAGPRRVSLFDEGFELKHDWSTPDTLVLAESNGTEVVILDGMPAPRSGLYSGTVRWLALRGGFDEHNAVPLPVDFAVHPKPKLLIWPDRLSLVLHDGVDWQECRLAPPWDAFSCERPAWRQDLKALHPMLRSAVVQVFRSGPDAYVVAVPNGCAIWSRRYDQSHSITAQQLMTPEGSSSLGMVQDVLFKDSGGSATLLTSALLTSGGDGGQYRTVLRGIPLSTMLPLQPTPRIEGCPSWNDVDFSRGTTADEVASCVEKGADPNAVHNCGAWTRPLAIAARLGNAGTVRALIRAGAEVNARDEEGDTALHDAVHHGESEAVVEALLDGGADVTLRNANGKVAWDYARENDALRDTTVVRNLRPDSL